ncbi:MAG: DNA mismatch repair protein MutS [Chloroflexi bacterium]|nr:DNA mismatch repair protein MutS [Chloroflexota bacterium]
MTTPVRRQYLRIHQQYPDAILLFRMGDFYETFDEDAKLVARELDIALTSREMGKGERVPLAGVPYHALDGYLARLIKKGYKVAICEQTSDPATSRGLVDREVVRVVTPGTVVETALLEDGANNYLASVVVEGEEAGLAYTDVSTSNGVSVTQMGLSALALELGRLSPAEVLLPRGQEGLVQGEHHVALVDDGTFRLESSRRFLMEHLGVKTLEGYGCEDLPLAIRAAGGLMAYLGDYHREALERLTRISTYYLGGSMTLDAQTRRNLELFQGGRWDSKEHSLLSVLDLTRTSMGARTLRQWLGQPLLNLEAIEQRLESVAWCHRDGGRRQRLVRVLGRISDMERLVNRVRGGSAMPRDLVGLRQSLEAIPELRDALGEGEDAPQMDWLTRRLPPCQETASLIREAIEDEPGKVGEGTVVRVGFSPELDELRTASRNARGYIAKLEGRERERTGIKNLKVGYNRVFGYYIEVSRSNLSRVPDDYQRRQTLTGGERYITPELKEYESLILNARERMEELESTLYRQVCRQVGDGANQVLQAAETVAHVDVFASLGEAADRYGYVRPEVDNGQGLQIAEGRHPVVERVLPPGSFVPNDTTLSADGEQLVVLTGPNMSGKSTYIRQVALIVLMAQMGSFVPAKSATVGLVDRIFTRVGLQDDLATGQSTFMVEMTETATILNNATRRSLIILDEIGRGTSTYDGLSIAQAVAEHVHNDPELGCRTLFATHYHELTELANTLPRARNYSVAVTEEDGEVVFLHRIVPGGAGRSYGIHVAQLAGLPRDVIRRAWEVLDILEEAGQNGMTSGPRARSRDAGGRQLGLFAPSPEALEELLKLDVAAMTPMEAINALYTLQEKAKKE